METDKKNVEMPKEKWVERGQLEIEMPKKVTLEKWVTAEGQEWDSFIKALEAQFSDELTSIINSKRRGAFSFTGFSENDIWANRILLRDLLDRYIKMENSSSAENSTSKLV